MKKLTLLFCVIFTLSAINACKKDSKRRIDKYHRQTVGDSAKDILSNEKYKSITIEIIYMTGFAPTSEAVADLKTLVSARCNKSKGITVVMKEIPASGQASYSLTDIAALESEHRSQYTYRKDIAVCFLFVDGPSADNQGSSVILGQAYYNTSMVIFEKTVKDLSGGFGEPPVNLLESIVINHEFGHILGLVNLGSGMQTNHEDGSHAAHCTNQNCLMYWQAETGNAVTNMLGGGTVPDFDANCIADLQANGGK